MFAPEGWISLREVFLAINEAFQETGRMGEIEFFGDENFEVTWLYAVECKDIAVCLADGNVLPASRSLVFPRDWHDNQNEHVDLIIGTVGSAQSPLHAKEAPTERELARQYGPFLHLPIIFPKEDFLNFLNEFEVAQPDFIAPRIGETKNLPTAQSASPTNISNEIVRLFDLGELPKFDAAKTLLGETISVRAFRFAWNLAREKRPEISKPGRKRKGPKS